MMKRIAYCFDCKKEIEVCFGSESCPSCGSDNWNFPPKHRKGVGEED